MKNNFIISGIIAFFVWLCLTLTENVITDYFLKLIREQADAASQYDPMYGALINLIPSVIIFGGTFGLCESVTKGLGVN